MSELVALREKLRTLHASPWTTPAEVKALEAAIEEAKKQLESLPPPDCPLLDAAITGGKVGPDLNAADVMSKADFDEIVTIGKSLGVESLRVTQLYSQLEACCGGASNTRIGMFALRILVENAFLHQHIGRMNELTSSAVVQLNILHKPAKETKKNGKSG